MATTIELDAAGKLFKLDPALEPNEQEWRVIYTSPDLRKWIEDDLPTMQSIWNLEASPIQQLDALVETFCSGENLCVGTQFKSLQHLGDGLWQLKTADLRIFGWFPVKDCFIGWRAHDAYTVKKHNLYAGFAGEAVRFRGHLDLNEPKFVTGDDPNAVVSNWTYP